MSNLEQLVSNIVNCKESQDLFHANGLSALAVSWEDTARTKGSFFGPNISDMTLMVKNGNKLMPVIRKPNFSDVTHDVPVENFKVRVGNEKENAESKIVSLKDYLSSLNTYCPDQSENLDLTNPRDTVVLTSTQCCVLPVQKGEKTEFAVQLFNYQSMNEDPAVLVVLVSKDGTSAQVLERSNQKLMFNDNGKSRWFSVERLEDSRERNKVEKTRVDSYKEMKDSEKLENTIMVIQVPLKRKVVERSRGMSTNFTSSTNCCTMKLDMVELQSGVLEDSDYCNEMFCDPLEEKTQSLSKSAMTFAKPRGLFDNLKKSREKRGMDMGQIGLGSVEGTFTGTKGLKLVRDDRFPIRCTFQYYRVTDENFVSEKNVMDIASQLAEVANVSVASGSLVLNEDTGRKTEPNLNNPIPTDCPLQKLKERDYLDKLSTNSSNTWSSQRMATF